jgi:hypothetical protein
MVLNLIRWHARPSTWTGKAVQPKTHAREPSRRARRARTDERGSSLTLHTATMVAEFTGPADALAWT